MTTYTAMTTLADPSAAEALGTALERMSPEPTSTGVYEIEDGSGLREVGGYFADKPDPAALALLATLFGAADFVISEVPDIDWVAHVRRELAPVEAGRFFVYGSHDADKVPEGSVALLIEAALAFGTGHHGTTLGCLRALDQLVSDGFTAERIADIGCGTAVLAMAAARIWPQTVIASDLDRVAVEVAQANLQANNLDSIVHCVEAAGFDHADLHAAAPYDLIFANILKGPLIALAPDMAAHLRPGGYLILSGILNEQAADVTAVYARFDINLNQTAAIGDWTTLLLRKMA